MITLTAPVTTETAAAQSGWAELYDIYLKSAIMTPWGSTSILRLCTLPTANGLSFFKPKIAPEATADQGDPETYHFWPLKRELIKGDQKFTNDKLLITASNVTREWAQMVLDVSWYDVVVIIRKVPTSSSSTLTADDCAILWSGQVDAVKITSRALALECSSDLAGLKSVLPSENMHTNCRFRWADDQCTQLRYRSTNYKTGTCGSSSTTTRVKSADFSEDEASSGSYGTDLVNALADGAITTSSEQTGYSGVAVSFNSGGNWFLRASGLNLLQGEPIYFTAGTMPAPLVASTTYYAVPISDTRCKVSATPGGAAIDITSDGASVLLYTVNTYQGFQVKSSKSGWWKFSNDADWGTATQGFWLIPDAQAGLANAALKPYITFDFGSAKRPKVWRIKTPANLRMEELVRLVVVFSSADAATWNHETYFELPPVGGTLYDVLIPSASSARYWRFCVRSRYGESLYKTMFDKVYAYENGRHYWASGTLKFASNTTTAALRGVARRVLESYSGEVVVPTLPAAPASGDTFTIERGCPRTFNACCERRNWENFGGFTDLPYQAVIR